MDVPFTQYIRPSGRPVPVRIDRPDDVAAKAQRIIDAGYRFETEVLTTGMVSFTIYSPAVDEDMAIELVENGPEVPAAVDRLINEFEEGR